MRTRCTHVMRGLPRTFEWTLALRTAVDMALAARPIDIAPWFY